MILSASRRTDIPTYYAEWLLNRLNEGFVFVRNPMNAHQVSRISINPDVVDCIVFWSKNPRPLMQYLDRIDTFGYPYYFQFTLTPYDQTIERNLPPRAEIEETFIELSQRIGKERMVWRYDPIFISSEWTVERHAEAFEAMAERLAPHADECIISFIDSYRSAVRRMGHRIDGGVAPETMWTIAGRFAKVAQKHDLPINTCAEEITGAARGGSRFVHRPGQNRALARGPSERQGQGGQAAGALRLCRVHRHRRVRHVSKRLSVLLCDCKRREGEAELRSSRSEFSAADWRQQCRRAGGGTQSGAVSGRSDEVVVEGSRVPDRVGEVTNANRCFSNLHK